MSEQRTPFRLLAPIAAALVTAGCLQLETRLQIHEDGSATITERLQFSKRLLEFQGGPAPKKGAGPFLERAAVLRRMKHMGKGIRLVRHQVRDADKGARESVAVFHIPKLTDLVYVSPFVAEPDYVQHALFRCREGAVYKTYYMHAGHVTVDFVTGSRVKKKTTKPLSPAELQAYRRLRPVLKSMLEGFQLKLVVESYAPVSVFRHGQRNRRARSKVCHLIDVSDDNRDRFGAGILDSEEFMLEVARMLWDGPNMRAHCAGFASDPTVPLVRFSSHGWRVLFKPSRHYFDKYFKGKKLDFRRGGVRMADPKIDIYRPPLTKPQGKP